MASPLNKLFEDKLLSSRIAQKLPLLFQLAEIDSSRAGKVGMEVGNLREKILVALLVYVFGKKNVETEIPTTESEVDVKLFGKSISIKTITGEGGVKAVWTVDPTKAKEFVKNYTPTCDILFAKINWGGKGGLFLIPLEVQKAVLRELGVDGYLKLPKPGTNPRGVEINKEALKSLLSHSVIKKIEINWQKKEGIKYEPYERWIEQWAED